MHKDASPLYILSKTWEYKPKMKMSVKNLDDVTIRPCNVSYNVYRRFSLGLPTKAKCITHEACAASWNPKTGDAYSLPMHQSLQFKTFEEFMMHAHLMCIFPTIENHLVQDYMHHRCYYIKTIDLKKNEVLYDNTKAVMQKLSESYAAHLV